MRSLRIPLLLLVCLIASGGANASAATKSPFSATLSLGQPDQPERSWQSGPIFHARGEHNAGTVSGDLNGPAAILNNYNLDLRTVDGANWGTFEISSGGVTWEGRFRGTLRAGFNEGTFVGHGTDGSLLRGSFSQIVGFDFLLQGVILDPRG
jgi:hypothetical protein